MNIMFFNFLTFTEWYHYAILFLWIVLLFVGVKYFNLLESHFKPKDGFKKGDIYGKNLLVASFTIGALMVLVFTFKPAQLNTQSELNWDYGKYLIYAIFMMLLLVNAYVSMRKYHSPSNILRLLIISFLMILFFYTGMYGGMLIIATLVLLILIYAIIKLKNKLTIS